MSKKKKKITIFDPDQSPFQHCLSNPVNIDRDEHLWRVVCVRTGKTGWGDTIAKALQNLNSMRDHYDFSNGVRGPASTHKKNAT